MGDTEVGGFGIAAADDLLLIEDVRLVRQVSTPVSADLDDTAVADFFDQQVDRGLRPERFARVWVHTHPGNGPEPSFTDEETFFTVFGRTQWAVMFILARGGRSYARLRFCVGPWADVDLPPVQVDYRCPFPASDDQAWKAEYQASVRGPALAGLFISPAPTAEDRGPEQPPTLDAEGLWRDDWFDPWDEAADSFFGYARDPEAPQHDPYRP